MLKRLEPAGDARESRHMKKNVLHGLISSALLFAASSAAQDNLPPRTQDFMRDMVSLSSTLGRVHAIRVACNGRDDQYWRDQMVAFLDLEAPGRSSLRQSMTSAFNDAYQREIQLRTACDAGARDAEAVYAAEGKRLSDKLASHYLPRQ